MELNFFSHAHIQSKNHRYAAVFNLKQAISLAKTQNIFASCEKIENGEIYSDKKKELDNAGRLPSNSLPIKALKIKKLIKSATRLSKSSLKENTKNSFKCLVGSKRVSKKENLESENFQLTIHEQNLLTKIAIVIKKSPKGVCFLSTERLAESIGKKKVQTCHLINKLISLNLIKVVSKRGHNRVYELTDLAKNNPRFFIKKETFERTKQAKKLYVFAKKTEQNLQKNRTKTIELKGSFNDTKVSNHHRVSKKEKSTTTRIFADQDKKLHAHEGKKALTSQDIKDMRPLDRLTIILEKLDDQTKETIKSKGTDEISFISRILEKISIKGTYVSDMIVYIKQSALNQAYCDSYKKQGSKRYSEPVHIDESWCMAKKVFEKNPQKMDELEQEIHGLTLVQEGSAINFYYGKKLVESAHFEEDVDPRPTWNKAVSNFKIKIGI